MTGKEVIERLLLLAPFAVVIGFVASLRMHRRATRLAAGRWRERPRMGDEDFLRGCEIPDEPLAVEVALAARKVTAQLGTVPPETIRPDDSFGKDLVQLPFWDSLEWACLLFEVEHETGCRLSWSTFHDDVDKAAEGRARDLQVRHVVKVLARSAARER